MPELSSEVARWVVLVTGVDVVRAEPLVGGMSSEVHRCWSSDGSTFVVRHITNREWLAREPYLIEQEAIALQRLVGTDIPAPGYVASDPQAGLLLMTFMPGVMLLGTADLSIKAPALGELASRIAAVDLPDDHGLNPWRPWAPPEPKPPAWGDHGLWQEAIDLYQSKPVPQAEPAVLLHRDLHPMNVLWNGDEISALVDWVNACVGHPHAELGHCRWNLTLLAGSAVADSFLDGYLRARGEDHYDPWWDIVPVMSFLPGPLGVSGWQAAGREDMTLQKVEAATDRFLATALSRL